MDGWIKLYRKITENPLYFSEPFTRLQAWIDLLVIANNEENYIYVRGNKVQVKRGQIAKTQDTLAERWKWSRGKVIRFLDELQKSGQIVQQKSRLITLISVINYERYQCGSTTDSTSNGTSDDTTDSTTENTSNGTTDSTDKNADNQSNTFSDLPGTVQQNNGKTVQQIGHKQEEYNIILSPNVDNISSPPKGEEAIARASEGEAEQPSETTPRKKPLPFKKIVEMWNATCTSYPKVFTFSEPRKNKIRIRIEEMGGIEKAMPILETIFKKMQESKFLQGESKSGWKASFDWVFENGKNWVKVWEGNYDEKKNGKPVSTENPKTVNDIWENR